MEGVRKPLGNSSWCDVSESPGEEDEPCWIWDYERAYGVTKAEDHALFIALIEDADHTPNQTGIGTGCRRIEEWWFVCRVEGAVLRRVPLR